MTMLFISSNPEAQTDISGVVPFMNGDDMLHEITEAQTDLNALSQSDLQQLTFSHTALLNTLRSLDRTLEVNGASAELLEQRSLLSRRAVNQQNLLISHNAFHF